MGWELHLISYVDISLSPCDIICAICKKSPVFVLRKSMYVPPFKRRISYAFGA